MNTRGVPKEGSPKDTPLPRSRTTPKDNHKTDTTPWELARVTGSLVANECNPHFCPAAFGGSNLKVAKPSSQETKMRQKEANAIPGRERINNHCLFRPIWISKQRDNMKFYLPLSTRHHRKRLRWADFSKNCHPLPAPASFPRVLSVGSGESGVCQWVSSW